jgi:hypothetical protein
MYPSPNLSYLPVPTPLSPFVPLASHSLSSSLTLSPSLPPRPFLLSLSLLASPSLSPLPPPLTLYLPFLPLILLPLILSSSSSSGQTGLLGLFPRLVRGHPDTPKTGSRGQGRRGGTRPSLCVLQLDAQYHLSLPQRGVDTYQR